MVDAPDCADLGAGQRVGAGEAASVEVKSSSAIVLEAEEERAEAPTLQSVRRDANRVKHGEVRREHLRRGSEHLVK